MTKDQIEIIKVALDYQDSLTDWEAEFINSLADKDDGYSLSEKQEQVLQRIATKVI